MNKFLNLFNKLFSHELISGSFYIFLGTTVASFLAFILNLYFARNLSYADYGIFASLLSLFNLAIIPSQSVGPIIVRFGSQFISLNETDRASAFYRKVLSYLTISAIIIVFSSVVFGGTLSKFLKIQDVGLIIFTAIVVGINYVATVNIGYLNSLLKFKFLSFTYLLGGVIKLIVGAVLVLIGWRVYGALIGIASMMLFQFLLAFVPLKKIISVRPVNVDLPLSDIVRYSIPAAIATFFLFSFVSSDVLLVKHFFSAKEAGLYGGLSIVGKVIFYFTLPIPSVMFPLLVKRHAQKIAYKNLLYISLILVSIPSVLITFFYLILPSFTIHLFLGRADYHLVAPYLFWYGIYMSLFSLVNVFVGFYLSIKNSLVSVFVFLSAILQIVLIYRFHQGFGNVIGVSIISLSLLLTSLALYYVAKYGVKNSS